MDEAELPRNVALLWGLRPAPRRGRAPGLTLDAITQAAIRIADAEGLAAVSMARVAAEVGSATMSLYRYVASKDELLLLMSDAALDDPPEPVGKDWRERLTAWAHAVLAVIRKHPWYREIPISGPPVGPRNLAYLDRALGALEGLELPAAERLLVVMGLLPIVHGQARLSIDLAAGYAADPEAFDDGYARALAGVLDPTRFPALSRAFAESAFDPDPADLEATTGYDDYGREFAFTLSCYFDGVERYVAARNAGRADRLSR